VPLYLHKQRLIEFYADQGLASKANQAFVDSLFLRSGNDYAAVYRALMKKYGKTPEGWREPVGVHHFVQHSYKKPTFCHHCHGMLLGVRHQGLQCRACRIDVHRRCAAKMRFKHRCVGKPRRRIDDLDFTCDESKLAEQLKRAMRETLLRTMREWKEANPRWCGTDGEYERFLFDTFPENIRTVPKESVQKVEHNQRGSFSSQRVTWVDNRVMNDWRDMFFYEAHAGREPQKCW